MWNIIIGIAFIFGGLSGEFVLRGTNSSAGLSILGVVLLLYGIGQMTQMSNDQNVES